MLRSSVTVIGLLLIILLPSIQYQSYAEETKIKDELTAPCGIMPFGGEEVGSFELETRVLKTPIGGKSSDWIESLKIWMNEPPEGEYIVGFMGVGARPSKLPEALVKIDEYRADGRVMITENKSMPFFSEVLFVAQRDSPLSTGWSLINMTGAAYLEPPIKSFPEPNKVEYKNATIVYRLDVGKHEYNVGENLVIKPSLVNIGSENVTINHGDPLFWFNMYTLDGEFIHLDPWPRLDIYVGTTLEPGVPYTFLRTLNAQSMDPVQYVEYPIKFCMPGEYKLVSYAWLNVEEHTGQGYSNVKEVRIYAEPVTIKVNAMSHVDKPPVIISKVELWGPAYFVEGVNVCGWGKSSISDAFQWVEIRNTKEETVKILDDWSITVTNGTQLGFAEGLTLGPKESCLIQTADSISVRIGPGGSGGLGPPHGYNGSSVILKYSVDTGRVIAAYKDSTPEFSDTYGDTRNWQLIGGEWIFKNGMLTDADRTTLTETTEDGSVIVNLILAEEITAPIDSKFRVSFIDASTQQLMHNVIYQMIFEGTSMPVNTSSVPLGLVGKDNPFKREWSIDGIAKNGTDTQIYSISSPGSLNITIRILGINNMPIAKLSDVKFSTLATTGSPEHLQITEVELNSFEGGQWIELHNPTDRPIKASKVVLKQLAGEWATAISETPLAIGFGKQNFTLNSVVLQPDEYRVFEVLSDDESSEERFLTSRSVLSLMINEREVSRTPELTDDDADSRTWQLEEKQWVFAEATPSRAIPEFPFAIMIASSAVGVMLAMIRFRKLIKTR